MLNKSKGNMYGFITHTWNPIKGKCPHDCSYCYMKRWPQKELRLDEKCFSDNLGEGNFIFVGSSTDMFAENIPALWIEGIMLYLQKYPNNQYFFQSKNPGRFKFHYRYFPENIILATTIETNREDLLTKYSKAPSIVSRIIGMKEFVKIKKMVTIEPIMQFDLSPLAWAIKKTKPIQVNIGADSGNNNLPEPSKEEIEALIKELKKFTKVHLKDNLRRLV